VPVGGHPDKRPDSRRGRKSRGFKPRAYPDPTPRPAVGGDRLTLVLHEWTRLEATTERAFLVSSRPSKGRVTEEACPSCRACGRGFLIRYVGYSKGFLNLGFRIRIGSRYGAPAELSSTLNGLPPSPARFQGSTESCVSTARERQPRTASDRCPRIFGNLFSENFGRVGPPSDLLARDRAGSMGAR